MGALWRLVIRMGALWRLVIGMGALWRLVIRMGALWRQVIRRELCVVRETAPFILGVGALGLCPLSDGNRQQLSEAAVRGLQTYIRQESMCVSDVCVMWCVLCGVCGSDMCGVCVGLVCVVCVCGSDMCGVCVWV